MSFTAASFGWKLVRVHYKLFGVKEKLGLSVSSELMFIIITWVIKSREVFIPYCKTATGETNTSENQQLGNPEVSVAHAAYLWSMVSNLPRSFTG